MKDFQATLVQIAAGFLFLAAVTFLVLWLLARLQVNDLQSRIDHAVNAPPDTIVVHDTLRIASTSTVGRSAPPKVTVPAASGFPWYLRDTTGHVWFSNHFQDSVWKFWQRRSDSIEREMILYTYPRTFYFSGSSNALVGGQTLPMTYSGAVGYAPLENVDSVGVSLFYSGIVLPPSLTIKKTELLPPATVPVSQRARSPFLYAGVGVLSGAGLSFVVGPRVGVSVGALIALYGLLDGIF